MGGGAGGLLFKGVLYILYGRRAGETTGEKTVRAGLVIGSLVIVFLAINALGSLIREHFLVERAAPIPIEWGVPPEEEMHPEWEMHPEGEMAPKQEAPLP